MKHYITIYKNAMQPGKVESTGNNVGGLVGNQYSYNQVNAGYIQNNYIVVENSFATGEVIGNANTGALVGNAYRRSTCNDANQNAYIQISNSYAIGKVTSQGEAGGLLGQLASTYYGSTTTSNSYWTPETTKQEKSKTGTRKNVQSMLYYTGYVSWDFNNIWKIEDGQTLAYLKNANKPEAVNKENLTYEAFDIIGSGTTQDPYIITTAVQLQKVNENLEATYKLGANINLTGLQWQMIGSETYPFKGTIDGNGYTISNLSIDKSENNVGLFGYNSGTIKNIKINNFNVKGIDYVGIVTGTNTGNISNCQINGSTVTGTSNVGGIAGYNTGSINSSTISGNVNGTTNVGGVVGYTIGSLDGNNSDISVKGITNVGGVIGYLYVNNKDLSIESQSSKGSVEGTTNVGGVIRI